MKRWIALLLAATLSLSIAGCGGGGTEADAGGETAVSATASTDYMTVDGLCVDDSYTEDGNPLKMVYLFYTLTAAKENLKIDSKNTILTVDGTNSYQSENHADKAAAAKFAPNYYYGNYLRDVYTGESKQVIATFKIPEGDLAAGKTITLKDDQIPEADKIELKTDDIQRFENAEAIAKAMDPEGYAAELEKRKEADADTANKAKGLMNGYQWEFYVNKISYELEFFADHDFELRTSLGTSKGGTYSVRNGYIFCTYADTGYMVEIPYKFENGDITLDAADAFDVNI